MKRLLIGILVSLSACTTPNHNPDMTASGMVVGGGIGSGAGAIVGNQLSHLGEGAAVGAGIGAVSGIMAGISADILESEIATTREEISSLNAAHAANGRILSDLQRSIDDSAFRKRSFGLFQVFFDENATTIKSGSVSQLDVLIKELRQSQTPLRVSILGHADDSGDIAYNDKLSAARAREVAAIFTAHGISEDQLDIYSFGSHRPLLSNATPKGRELNRRVEVFINQKP